METYGFSISQIDTFTEKKSKKLHANRNKYQGENCPTLPGRNLISTCNCRARSVPAVRGKISPLQTGIT